MILCAALFSCGKPAMPGASERLTQNLEISLADPGYELTRGYFDGGTAPETWEKELFSVEVFAFQNGELLLRHRLTDEELAARKVTLALPRQDDMDWAYFPIKLYFVANYAAPEVYYEGTLEELTDDAPALYNCPGEALSPGAKWASGFTMTALHELNSRSPEALKIHVTLKRTVAKIAVRATVDPAFTANYQGGTLEITGASVVRTASDGLLFNGWGYELYSARNFTHTVTAVGSGAVKEFVFYICPNDKLNHWGYTDPNSPALIVEGIFDEDGNPATISDRHEIRYQVFLNEEGGCLIGRNQVYKYDLRLIGLEGAQVQTSYQIQNWLDPETMEAEAGK